MSNDPLAQYRKKPLVASEKAANGGGAGEGGYCAFEAKDRVDRLRIIPADEPVQAPLYLNLVNVAYDGDYGTEFVLMFGFMGVRIVGRNLQPVISALLMGTAEYIREFDPELFDEPKDEKAPFIKSIKFEVQEGFLVSPPAGETVH